LTFFPITFHSIRQTVQARKVKAYIFGILIELFSKLYQMQIQLLLFQILVSKTTLPLLLLMSILTSTLLRKHSIKLSMSPQLNQNYLSSDVRLVKLFKSLMSHILLLSLILFIQLKGYLTLIFIFINYSQLLSLKTSDHTSTNTPTTPSNSGIVQVMKSGHFIY